MKSPLDFFHNSQDVTYRKPFGAVTPNSEITLSIKGPESFDGQVCLRLWADHREQVFPMKKTGELWQITVAMPEKPQLVWYFFIIDGGFCYGNNGQGLGGVGAVYSHEPPAYQITVSETETTPEWFHGGVMYQIFPDSFHNGNPDGRVLNPKKNSLLQSDWYNTPSYQKDENGRIIHWVFYGGNLQGIEKKLDYLATLGVTVIYLNPVFEAASPHRYDTADYMAIDPVLGTEADFISLATEAKKRGMYLILDGVFSHTGANSRYFNKFNHYDTLGAYQSHQSPYYDWYRFDQHPDTYECWWGVDDLPNVDEMNKSYRDFIYGSEDSVVRKWLRLGASGFRLDVADELPDQFIKELRSAIKETKPDAVLIGEVWEDASNKTAYDQLREYFYGDELDGVMNYPFRASLLDFMLGQIPASLCGRQMMQIVENYPKANLLSSMNLLSTHDRSRALTLLSGVTGEGLGVVAKENYQLSEEEYKAARKKLKALYGFLFALPGLPSIYYGDEAGMEGFADPFNRRSYPWGKEDTELRDFFVACGQGRKRLAPLLSGKISLVEQQWEDLLVFSMEQGEDILYLLLNRGGEKTVALEAMGVCTELYGQAEVVTTVGILAAKLPSCCCRVYLCKKA